MSYTDQNFETAASHTPGPWTAIEPNSRESYGNDVWEVHDGYGRTATVYGLDPEGPNNARLIAAAPDLLAACESIRNWSEAGGGDDNDEIEAAMGLVRRAIAKATQP